MASEFQVSGNNASAALFTLKIFIAATGWRCSR